MKNSDTLQVLTDCRYFHGDKPCKPHKTTSAHCQECDQYDSLSERILIIKLGAIGDVLRTTPLLRVLRDKYPNAQITWITQFPDILSENWIDRILGVTHESIVWLNAVEFDWVINLDKDPLAIGLTKSISAKRKTGFTLDQWGRCQPLDSGASQNKWLTGIWDDLNQANSDHYMKEIFQICGFQFNGEEYILDHPCEDNSAWNLDKNKLHVGINTGCGSRWTSRLWPEKYWVELAGKLKDSGYEVIVLGGEQEHEKNLRIANSAGVYYPGFYDLKTFICLVNQMDLMVTAVTLAMHLAIGLKKKLVLFNNIFNPNEFFLYERGIILKPSMDCDCYFTPTCPNHCMESLNVEAVEDAVHQLFS